MEANKLTLEELNRIEPKEFLEKKKLPIHVILENIRSGMNVGSFFRTSDALAIEKISLIGITPTPPHKEILKTAIGANHVVEWQHYKHINQCLANRKSNSIVISIEQTDKSFSLDKLEESNLNITNQEIVLIFGNEVEGVSKEAISLSDYCCEIPQFGTKHSFNVAVCGGIVLWEFSKHLGFAKS